MRRLRERLTFAHGDRTVGRDVRPPSSFQPFLQTWRRDLRALRAVAPAARRDEILQAGGSALGPRIEMVAVLRGTGTTTAEITRATMKVAGSATAASQTIAAAYLY